MVKNKILEKDISCNSNHNRTGAITLWHKKRLQIKKCYKRQRNILYIDKRVNLPRNYNN